MSTTDSDDEVQDGCEILKYTLLNEIELVQSTGSFAASGVIEDFLNPGISINSSKPIRLPLSSEDAEVLIKASHQAPFGQGTETRVDETVRKTWEIDADKVDFHNTRWQKCVDRVADIAAKDLGVVGGGKNVRADFYKMLVYGKGAMFKKHRDTEKTPGMFATLVICLPSLHEGGHVLLQHGGETKKFATCESSAFDATYIAWYADVNHEIETVQSGYRWVLVYNLINVAQTGSLSANFLAARLKSFTRILDDWHHLTDRPSFLIYPLAHQYTNEGLRLNRLKGEDYSRAVHIAQSCAEHGAFKVLLANMELCLTDHQGEDEEKDSELYLARIVDLEGSVMSVYDAIRIAEWLILGDLGHDHRDPDLQRGGGYLGNQHAEIDQFFKDSVIVIVPNDKFASFSLGSNPPQNAFETLMKRLRPKAVTDEAGWKTLLIQICGALIHSTANNVRQRDLDLGSVAVSAMLLQNSHLFTEAVNNLTTSFGRDSYFMLGAAIGIQSGVIEEDSDILKALTKCKKLHQTFDNVKSFRKGFFQSNSHRHNEEEAKLVDAWLDRIISTSLSELATAVSADAYCLVDIITERGDKSFDHSLSSAIRQFVVRFQDDALFSIPCFVELSLSLEGTANSKNYFSSLLDDQIQSVISIFDLQIYASYLKQRGSANAKLYAPGKIMVDLYNHAQIANPELLNTLLRRINIQASNFDQSDCKSFLLDILSDLLHVLNSSSTPAQDCVYSLLKAYLVKTVGHEPRKPCDWSRSEEVSKYCNSCEHCPVLNKFLMDISTESLQVSFKIDWHIKYSFKYLEFENQPKSEETVVKKTLKYWQEKHQEWQQRATKASETLNQLPEKTLKEFLVQRYDDILGLKVVKVGEAAINVAEKQTCDSAGSIVPQKRSLADL